jgi:hypothetical protein
MWFAESRTYPEGAQSVRGLGVGLGGGGTTPTIGELWRGCFGVGVAQTVGAV